MTNQTPLKVVWTQLGTGAEEATVSTSEEAMIVLRNVAQRVCQPTIVEFFDPTSGLSLAVGVGGTESVVTFQQSLDPPYFISVGEIARKDVVNFVYGNEDSEYLGRNAISMNAAESALTLFVRDRKKPANLAWERL